MNDYVKDKLELVSILHNAAMNAANGNFVLAGMLASQALALALKLAEKYPEGAEYAEMQADLAVEPDDWPPPDQADPHESDEPHKKCQECSSDDLEPIEWDLGRGRATGYHDAGMGYRCRACGATWEI